MATQQLGEEGIRWFVGLVEDINDPLKLGRARVRIINEHDENVKTEDIDWAHTLLPTTSSAVDGAGETPSLSIGSRVMGFFMDGNEKQIPVVIGTIPTIPQNDENRHSLSWLARGKNTITKQPLGPEPVTPYKAEYPYNKTITSRSGHVIEVDDTPEHERIHIYHKSGAYVEINNDGRVVMKSVADNYDIVANNKIVYVKGDLTANIVGNATITVKGNLTANVTGDVVVKASSITLDADTIHITGDLNVDKDITATGEVTGKGIHLSTHTHGGVDSGNSNTDKPN